MNQGPKLEDIFASTPGDSLHDEKEIKRLFLEGSKVGKNIIKKTDQLTEVKKMLHGLDMQTDIKEMKTTLAQMYSIYESGKSLETKLGNLSRTNSKVTVLGICYNLVATKLDTLENLRADFDMEIEGY